MSTNLAGGAFAAAFLASGLAYEAPSPAFPTPGTTLEAAPLLLWQRPLPGDPPNTATRTETAAPVVDAKYIYVGYSGVSGLLVLDRRDGAVVHELATQAPVVSAPVLTETMLYVTDAAGYTSAFLRDRLGQGLPAWTHFSGAPILSSPTVVNGVVYVTNVDDLVYALDAGTGELKWRHAHKLEAVRVAELELFGAPAPVVAGDTVLVGFSDGFLVGLGAADGSPRWSASIGEGIYPDLIAPPQPVGNSVVVGGYSEPLVSLDPASRSVQWRLDLASATPFTLQGETLWHGSPDGLLHRIDARTGNIVWTWDSGTGGSITTPIPTAQGLLVASSEGSMYLVDPESGTTRWAFDPGYLLTGISGAPAVDGSMIYAVSNGGILYALRGGEGSRPAEAVDWVSPPPR
ncbi:MAG: PQQ-binding-like beta-propeller repeat protein [Pseudomonadota bacterium]|nr:PQQ-binding-like beta-propeller repeat protein [Pseudomonadota bacterium]